MKKVLFGVILLAMLACVVAVSFEFVNMTPSGTQVAEQPSQDQVANPPSQTQVETMAVTQQGMVFRPPTPPDENIDPPGLDGCPLGYLCCENDKFRIYVSSEIACPEQHLDLGDAPLNCTIGPAESYYPNVYRFSASGGQPVDPIVEQETDLAVLTTPPPGSVLTGPDVVFMWNPATRDRIRDYYVSIGTGPRKSDLFWLNRVGSNLAVSVEGLPVDGSNVYVTLWSAIPTTITMEARVVETTIVDTNGVHNGYKWGETTFP